MKVLWLPAALDDVERLHDFLAAVSPQAAAAVRDQLRQAPRLLRSQPRIGRALPEFAPHEVRRLLVGSYELRYAIKDDTVTILRLWHTREER
jgi:plasmid stabilization system protein ParE